MGNCSVGILLAILSIMPIACNASGGIFPISENPYFHICQRNVFGLKPPPPAIARTPVAPLPKIILTGITTILGDKRALLKVLFPPEPPQPAKQKSCILAEGKQEGSIRVLEINEKSACVKVDNGGTVIEITFEKNPPTQPPPSQPLPRTYWSRQPIPSTLRSGIR